MSSAKWRPFCLSLNVLTAWLLTGDKLIWINDDFVFWHTHIYKVTTVSLDGATKDIKNAPVFLCLIFNSFRLSDAFMRL